VLERWPQPPSPTAAMAPSASVALPALAVAVALALQGCGGGAGTTATTTEAPITTTTTTTTAYRAPGQCSDEQRKNGCANGFCGPTGGNCTCMANFDRVNGGCQLAKKPQPIKFYMYRSQDERNFTWANDDLASISGVVWYLHNEVVVQSCPRHFGITRVLRLEVTVHNADASFQPRKSLFGPFATFDSLGCHDCQEQIFDKYGYVVGCEIPGAADNYTWAGYRPLWYDLPGECPSKDIKSKTQACKKAQPGGKCDQPDGGKTCTWNYKDAGFVRVEELYGDGFDYKAYCEKLGGHNVPGEYDRSTDRGKGGVDFWDDKGNAARNAQRVERLRAVFRRRYPTMPDLPEPWCDYAAGPPNMEQHRTVDVHL